jgi:apolipoprotein N-acyltransferase
MNLYKNQPIQRKKSFSISSVIVCSILAAACITAGFKPPLNWWFLAIGFLYLIAAVGEILYKNLRYNHLFTYFCLGLFFILIGGKSLFEAKHSLAGAFFILFGIIVMVWMAFLHQKSRKL